MGVERAPASIRRPSLVGRDRERNALEQQLVSIVRGEGSTIVVLGDPGIGKTTIIDWFVGRCTDEGIRTVRLRGDPVAGEASLSAVAPLLPHDPDHSTDERGHHGDDPTTGPPPSAISGALFSAMERVIGAVEQLSATPLVIAVEDLHWVDEASLSVLGALSALTRSQPTTIVATSRPAGRDDAVARLLGRFDGGEVIHLAPLTPDETHELLRDLLAASPGPRLAELTEATGGIPLLVTELVRGLQLDERLVTVSPGVVEATGDALPESLRAAVQRRLELLDHEAVDVVRSAAILGVSIDVDVLAEMEDQPIPEIVSALETSATLGLVTLDGATPTFGHELLRDAICDSIPVASQAVLHRRAADALDALGRPAATAAGHLARGARPGDAEVVTRLRRAAEELRSTAPTSALDLVERSLEVAGAVGGETDRLRRLRLDLLIQVGRLSEATDLAQTLLDDASAAAVATFTERNQVQARLAGLLVLQNRADEAVDLLDVAVGHAHGSERARLVAQRAMARLTAIQHAGSREDAVRAIELGESHDDPVAESLGLAVLARVDALVFEYARAREPARRAVSTADRDHTGEAHLHLPWFLLALMELDVDDLTAAHDAVSGGRAVAERYGQAYALPLYCAAAAAAHLRGGDLDDAWVEATTGIGLAADTGSDQALMWCQAICSLVARHRGEHEVADEWAAAATAQWEARSTPLGVDYMALAQSAALERAGRGADALEVLRGSWELFGALGLAGCQPLLASEIARLAVQTGDRQVVADCAVTLDGAASTAGTASLRALAMLLRGLADDDLEAVSDAADQYRSTPRRLEHAGCLEQLARLHCSIDRRAGTRDAVAAAEAYERLGALGSAQRASELVGRTHAARSRTDRFGWDALTPTERAIVDAVADGLTNAEIAERRGVSRRTIESHLVRVYAKLGISGRVQLAVRAAGRS